MTTGIANPGLGGKNSYWDLTIRRVLTMSVAYRDIITVEAGKRGGKPCIRGTRITVYDILSYLAAGMAHVQILADFPELREDDILACLAFAADRERQTQVTPV